MANSQQQQRPNIRAKLIMAIVLAFIVVTATAVSVTAVLLKKKDNMDDQSRSSSVIESKALGASPTAVSFPPSDSSSREPSSSPSDKLTANPTFKTTMVPSLEPTFTLSSEPTVNPSTPPSNTPSLPPSIGPTTAPSNTPSLLPSIGPTTAASDFPSETPSDVPSGVPSGLPSDVPSDLPSDVPSDIPSDVPSDVPSDAPSSTPATNPTSTPTSSPTAMLFGASLCEWNAENDPTMDEDLFWLSDTGCGVRGLPRYKFPTVTGEAWKAVAPTPESVAAMGDKVHVQTTTSWIRVDSPYTFTSGNDWTIAFSGASLSTSNSNNTILRTSRGRSDIVLGASILSNCYLCRIEYFQNDEFKQDQSLLSLVSDGADPWEIVDLPLPFNTNQFHILTLTHNNGLLRIYQNTTQIAELESNDAWLDMPYIGHLENPVYWFPGYDGHLAVHRIVHIPEAIEDGHAMDEFVKFVAA